MIKQTAVENKVLLTLLSDLIYSIGRHYALQDKGEVLWEASKTVKSEPAE
ncbi:hypothetical protein [uncultured Endozoicomonas sp.]|nr:hypothetical protein [uncultured Endozoicomonas sp.]